MSHDDADLSPDELARRASEGDREALSAYLPLARHTREEVRVLLTSA